jgi:diacylglycerol kinase (ATP)
MRVATLPGDAERLARAARNDVDVVAAAGGDGTVNAVANGLAGGSAALAVLPFGTANVLAREIGLPRRDTALAALLAAAPAQPVWPGRIGDRLFVTMAGAGFDAEIVARVNSALKRRCGRLAFAWAILAALCRGPRTALTVDCNRSTRTAAAAIVAKAHYYAGPFVLAPAAWIAEPLLHVVLFRRGGRRSALRYLAAMALGRVHLLPDVEIIPTRRVTLAAAVPGPVQADGEIVGEMPVTIELAAAPLMMIRPGTPPL